MPLLVLLFIAIPIAELYVIIQVGDVIGIPLTILLLLFMSVAGAWLVKREGLRAWRRFRTALDEVRIPAVEVIDGALVLLAGALMLTPGFLTDIVGLLLVLPPTRAVANRLVRARARLSFGLGPLGRAPHRSAQRQDEPVEIEVVEVKRSRPTDSRPAE